MPSEFWNRPLLEVASFARRGPGRRDRLTPAEIDHVRRTVRKAPEVMVKVLTGGQPTMHGARDHLAYVGREGELELETDQGDRLSGDDAADRLVDDWDLDLEEHRPGVALRASGPTKTPKLVHKLVFSMPAGTPPQQVLGAVRDFARQEFAFKYRYAFVLHTDEDHPHVHLVVKATGEDGTRLNIRKDTLREWRSRFAAQLRARGVEANATERAARGKGGKSLKDGIYRAALRRQSTLLTARLRTVVAEKSVGEPSPDPGAWTVAATNRAIREGYFEVSQLLIDQGEVQLGRETWRFAEKLPFARSDRERMRDLIRDARERARDASRDRDSELTMLR
jgi:hypothetical protein